MRGIGIVNAVGNEIKITADARERESFRIPAVAVHLAFFETEMRRGKIVPDAARAFVAEILGLDQRRLVAHVVAIGPA